MPLKYWDQAFLTATHLINHTPTKILDYDTPIHHLLGATPDYTNMRTFGCACWPNLQPYNCHKLQFHSICCVFLGYSNLHKGYKCLTLVLVTFISLAMSSLMKIFSPLHNGHHLQVRGLVLMSFFYLLHHGKVQIQT
jgi:hypothetical protein